MQGIQAVEVLLFDVGNVLVRIDPQRCLQHWAQFSPLSVAEMALLPAEDEFFKQHERGEISDAAFFESLRQRLSLTATDAQIQTGWDAMLVEEIEATVGLIRQCHQRIPCSVFSNTNSSHQQAWSRNYAHFLDLFERVFVSSEMGLRKPDKVAFEWVCAQLAVPADKILFFDDRQDNIDGARAAGLQAVLVSSSQDVASALQQLQLI